MRARVRFWLFLVALILFGRIFQSGVLWPEEGLPLAAAQQMLAGQVLYRDIWFDKPPLLAWFYAGVLRVTGHSGYGLRLVGVLYILAVSFLGYALARRLWDEEAARWAAFFLAFFTSFYIHSATVALAADLLLVLPHLAVFYFVTGGRPWAAGLCAGAAFHVNTKAVFLLAAAGAWMLAGGMRRRLPALLAGFAAAGAAGLAVVVLQGGWSGYVEQVWRWGAAYAGAAFTERPWALGVERTANYLGFHAALVVGAAVLLRKLADERLRMGLWIALSFAAVAAGARFFPRYYFQMLPPLAMAAGWGWSALARRWLWWAVLAAALAAPAIRFGRTNLWLAAGRSFAWNDVAIDSDSRRAALHVRRWTRPGDKIFVWGFRPEIYYYSQRLGATRFLESQPLTGVPADRHLERWEPLLPHRRAELLHQLWANPPAVIVDGLGPYNPRLRMENYPELRAVLEWYRLEATTSGTRIYVQPPAGSGG